MRSRLADETLVVVTNRQPPDADIGEGQSGGLLAALNPAMQRCRGIWISGRPVAADGSAASTLNGQRRHVDARYPEQLHAGYYYGFSNRVLWPLYHSMMDAVGRYDHDEWRDYRHVNEHFADTVTEQSRGDGLIWVHDYQLSLLPALVRRHATRRPRIAFCLHIPFPPYDIFRTLPWAREVLRGMLGADLISLHTAGYCRNLYDCIERLLDVPCDPRRGEVRINGRRVRVRAIPVGADTTSIYDYIDDDAVQQDADDVRRQLGAERVLLAVDRLDYTKGIERRLEAIDLLFEHNKSLRGRMCFVQVGVPSRERIKAYRRVRSETERLVGHINGKWGHPGWTPVTLMVRSLPLRELVALYLAADVALVTPLRDGMNLVAKEYCAAHRDRPGVLVLSEFAGAAGELTEALLTNPYDVESLSEVIMQAVDMPNADAADRMCRLNENVARFDTHRWVDRLLAEVSRI